MNNRLTVNSLIKSVKRRLGIRSLPLQITDQDYIDILNEITLPEFSIYFPRYITRNIDISTLTPLDNTEIDCNYYTKRFLLPREITEKYNIIDISRIEYMDNPSDFMYYSNNCDLSSFETVIDMYGQQTINNMMNIPVPHRFEAPNVLYIDDNANIFNCTYILTFLVVHASDLSTISYTAYENLKNLFYYDIQVEYYNELKRYDKINSQFGTIDLKIDDWENARDNRKDLLDNFNRYFLNARRDNVRLT